MSDSTNPDPPKKNEFESSSISRQSPSPSIFNTFIDRIKNIIRIPTPEPQVLTGRFQNLKQSFATTMTALEVTLEQMKEGDGESYVYANAILTPFLKDGERLMQQLSNTGIEQVRSIGAYSRWIESVNLWLLHFETLDANELREMFIKQNMQDAIGRVDKDLELIAEYLQQQLAMLDLSDETKQEFQTKIEEELGLYLFELQGLKIELPELDINGLDAWKAELNKRRETYFNAALSVIDRHIAGEVTTNGVEEEHHHLTDILKEIVELEEMLPHISAVLKQEGLNDIRSAMLTQIKFLKEKAHLLSLDLRLPSNLQDRLEEVINTLEEAENLLGNG